jgi:hypothetical protein
LLDELEALLDPADPSRVLSVRFRRAALALQEPSIRRVVGKRNDLRDLARALEMPDGFALLYDDNDRCGAPGTTGLTSHRDV